MHEQIYGLIDYDYHVDDHEYDDDTELKCYRCHYTTIYHIRTCPDANGTIHVQQIISANAKKQVRVPGVDNLCSPVLTYIVLAHIIRYNLFSSFAYSLLWALVNYNNRGFVISFSTWYFTSMIFYLFMIYFLYNFLIMIIRLTSLRSISSLYNSILCLFNALSF